MIKGLLNTEKSFDEISNIIIQSLGGIPIVSQTIKKGHYLARARTKSDDKPYNKLDQIINRKKEYVKSFGRGHCPNESIFYCSTKPYTAIREATQWYINDFGTLLSRNMLQDHNQHVKFVTVSVWKVVEDLSIASLFLNEQAMQANEVVNFHGRNVLNTISNKWKPEIVKSKNMILKFFSDEFAKKNILSERDYLLSAWYSKHVYLAAEQFGKLDGITYPSVAFDYLGENLALTDKAFKTKLKFEQAFHNYVANIEFDNKPMAVGTIYETTGVESNCLIWKDSMSEVTMEDKNG
ncbi:MAG: hypothetical protein OQJ96_05875 [Flavobacteriales bacterium]|nr:hypothetical protein [Flavobacteriales bacterium]MCW8937605.1 hypothetical protein [Flavobacteriales bacterium]MCW8968794.1 hypothetical protein [Flavobacteriales bacterium]MCW8990093.1 hypothetical protein [Flavobacteriales bacterium]MCW9019811.1 hypothetical protein [Flavobacteriales bacterium]